MLQVAEYPLSVKSMFHFHTNATLQTNTFTVRFLRFRLSDHHMRSIFLLKKCYQAAKMVRTSSISMSSLVAIACRLPALEKFEFHITLAMPLDNRPRMIEW